jgi:Ni/Fe-hydrogenase subunit HybB-like protein
VFRTKINAYPCDRLKEAKFNLEVELESARTTLVLGNMPTDIGRCTIEVPMRAAQRVEPYFDVFSFGSAVDATVYIRLVSMQFMNNFEDLQKMVARQSERQRMSHIEHS